MMNQIKPLVEINQKAIHVLYRELGVVDAVRFLKQFTTGYGDYTEERWQLFKEERIEDILAEIEKSSHKR